MINLFYSHCIFLYGCIGCDPSGCAFSGVPRLVTSARSGFLSGMNCRYFVLLFFYGGRTPRSKESACLMNN